MQLANEELAVFIPAHTGWLANERFAGHQLQAETVGQFEGLFAVLGRKRFRSVGRPGDLSVGGYGNKSEEQQGKPRTTKGANHVNASVTGCLFQFADTQWLIVGAATNA
jgi:hypothetical protein